MTIRHMCTYALSSILLLGAGVAVAQTDKPDPAKAELAKQRQARSAQLQAGIDKAAHLLENNPRFQKLTHPQRKELIEFVTGNMLFALLHELGHTHIQEMGLPVLGREEDAADSYAVVALLKVGTDVSHDVLVQATQGWFLSAKRNQAEKIPLAFYDEHGMDQQRAYQIICLMVGSDAEAFADLANRWKMPEDRQDSCAGDYSNASWSWETELKPHLRAPDQAKQKIKVAYGAPGDFPDIAAALRATGIMELLANYASDRYVWRRPFAFDVKACGQPDLHWDLSTQKILVCYEMAADFGRLYRDYGLSKDEPKAQDDQKQKK
jgi:hypothetical protein